MRARAVGRSAGVDDRQLPRVVERLERRQPRMHAEEPVEIERRIRRRAGPCDRDARPRRVVVALAERHDHVQAVDRAALEDRHQHLAPSAPLRPRSRARNCGAKPRLTSASPPSFRKIRLEIMASYLLWNSGEPEHQRECL